MKTVREFLTEYNVKQGWDVEEDSLIETLVECGNVVWRGKDDQHRWYIIRDVVKDIDGTFILFEDYIITGDACMSDMGLSYDLDKAILVERKERIVKEFYYEPIV